MYTLRLYLSISPPLSPVLLVRPGFCRFDTYPLPFARHAAVPQSLPIIPIDRFHLERSNTFQYAHPRSPIIV